MNKTATLLATAVYMLPILIAVLTQTNVLSAPTATVVVTSSSTPIRQSSPNHNVAQPAPRAFVAQLSAEEATMNPADSIIVHGSDFTITHYNAK